MILPNCEDVSTDLAMGELTLRARFHLLYCRYCRKWKRQLDAIELALRAAVFPEPDAARTAALERAVLARLKA